MSNVYYKKLKYDNRMAKIFCKMNTIKENEICLRKL